jgi:hypothetical protein
VGLRGFFRKNTAEEAAGREPEHQAGPPAGQHVEGRAGQQPAGSAEQGAGEPRPLPAEGPLAALVDRLTARGADRAVLTLVQRGNTMSHQTEQSSGDAAPAVESGTVDQDSPLFDPVADLYSQALTSPRGAWHTARLEVGPEHDGARPVVTTFGYADGTEAVETWRSGRSGSAAGAHGPAQGTAHGPAQGTAHDTAGEELPDRAAGEGPGTVTSSTPVITEAEGTPGQAAAGRTGHEHGHPEQGAPEQGAPEQDRTGQGFGGHGSSALAAGAATPAPGTGPAPDEVPAAPETAEPAGGERETAGPEGQRVPDHVDHEEWHEDVEPPAPTGAAAATAAAVAAGTTGGDDHDSSAPGTAVSTDVSPSYRAPAGLADRPSQDKLADGNLVLREADVLRRLADAQRRLFGQEGTAMDVSTVLVRVRALGTYYDALTHVRKNGFWDQRRTFDLVPEELLHVQEFKDESYVEGAGAPLAMMFRFRPGIPPEVSFDYADEEAFVRYEERLPAQNYLEELRMYPRTGANIPQHMNEALQDWNY